MPASPPRWEISLHQAPDEYDAIAAIFRRSESCVQRHDLHVGLFRPTSAQITVSAGSAHLVECGQVEAE